MCPLTLQHAWCILSAQSTHIQHIAHVHFTATPCRFTPHTSHLTLHTSHFTLHTSHLTLHTAHFTGCASFRTPAHVRREWEEEYGVRGVQGEEYEECMNHVCSRLGVHEGVGVCDGVCMQLPHVCICNSRMYTHSCTHTSMYTHVHVHTHMTTHDHT